MIKSFFKFLLLLNTYSYFKALIVSIFDTAFAEKDGNSNNN